MSPNRELTKLILAALEVADIEAQADKLEAKLLVPAIQLLRACDVSAARRLARDNGGTVRHVIRRMSLTDLRAVSKKWDPHRTPKATEAFQQDLINELIALAENARQPTIKPPPPPKPPRTSKTKGSRKSASVGIAAE